MSATSTKYNYLMPRRSIFNSRVSYDNTARDFSVSAGVTNLFRKQYYVNVFDYRAWAIRRRMPSPAGCASGTSR